MVNLVTNYNPFLEDLCNFLEKKLEVVNGGSTHIIFYKNQPDQHEAQIFLTFFILRLKIFLKNGDFQASAGLS